MKRAVSDLRWYALRLCKDKPERYEVYQTREGEETKLSDACLTVLAALQSERLARETAERVIGEALGFFASVIKSGESWTGHCDAMLQRARAALAPHPETRP